RLGSLVTWAADRARVPAGAALAVDRELFSRLVTEAISTHALITVVRKEIARIPEPDGRGSWIIATGPLTFDALSADIAMFVGRDHLSFYDAISPIVLAETIDHSKVLRQSRWDRSLRAGATGPRRDPQPMGPGRVPDEPESPGRRKPGREIPDVPDPHTPESPTPPPDAPQGPGTPEPGAQLIGADDGDYLNCPFTKEEYDRFYDALVTAESATVHDF